MKALMQIQSFEVRPGKRASEEYRTLVLADTEFGESFFKHMVEMNITPDELKMLPPPDKMAGIRVMVGINSIEFMFGRHSLRGHILEVQKPKA